MSQKPWDPHNTPKKCWNGWLMNLSPTKHVMIGSTHPPHGNPSLGYAWNLCFDHTSVNSKPRGQGHSIATRWADEIFTLGQVFQPSPVSTAMAKLIAVFMGLPYPKDPITETEDSHNPMMRM